MDLSAGYDGVLCDYAMTTVQRRHDRFNARRQDIRALNIVSRQDAKVAG